MIVAPMLPAKISQEPYLFFKAAGFATPKSTFSLVEQPVLASSNNGRGLCRKKNV